MESNRRYKIDVRDSARTTLYINRDHTPVDLAGGLIDACERLRLHRHEERRAGLRVIQGGAQ